MKPALQIGDWLFVNKMTYGPHVPFTNINLPGYREPQRGDIVVFISPYQSDEAARGADPTPTLVKRVVGVAGDTLYMRDKILYRNGEPQEEPYVLPDPYGQPSTDPLFEWQRTIAVNDSRFGPIPARPTHDNWGPLVVPEGHLFMMGDNRYDSKDSRYWGVVPRENVRGRPMFVYYSYNAEDSDRPLPFFSDIRWSRIGHWIR
jgi:signal peptidase I